MPPSRPSTRAEATIDAPIDAVFSVLSDPSAYAYWVVGSDKILDADVDWPSKGSVFEHVVGVWPLKSHDHSLVEEIDPPNHLRLRVKARPFLTARVWLDIHEHGDATRIEMYEDAADPLSKLLINPLTQPMVRARNEVSLKRLGELAEARTVERPL